MYKRQEDWFWKEDKVGTEKGHRSRLKRPEQQDKKTNLSAASCVKMTQARSTVQGTKEKIAAIESQEDRCLDKSFDKICTMDLLKAIWEETCLSKKMKKKYQARKKKKKKRETKVISIEGIQSAERPTIGSRGQKKLKKGRACRKINNLVWVNKI